jgi:CNT family concentrative nucleoside transporter
MEFLHSLAGLAGLVGIAWAISENRRAVPWRALVVGVALQVALALVLLRLPAVRDAFLVLNRLVAALQDATAAGTAFVFGHVGGGPVPYDVADPTAGFILAFQALPLVLVVSALTALLYHWRVLPRIVSAFAWVLRRTMGVGGAVGCGTAANVFVGMVEAPLFVRPYLATAGRGELFVIMTAGMATIAGTVMVLYATFLNGVVADPIGQLLTASLLSAPAAIAIARVMVPPAGDERAEEVVPGRLYDSAMDAVTRGTADGLRLLLNIIAMLVVLVALVHLANACLGLAPDVGGAPLTLQRILGVVLAPLAWLTGIPWDEAAVAGALLGTKIVLNELLAYLDLAALPAGTLSERSRLVMTYALCGFANFGSLGIMIGGLGAMVPDRRAEIVGLGLKSIVAGTLATCMTGAVVGLL